ncbi:MAG: threonine/serine exporter family protein [Fibrobacteres bacterium]|nr:threonine/serine exporter family protein [Fibrobacterota bacterium]
MMEFLVQTLYAAGATFGFTILFNTRRFESFVASLSGGLGWLVYLIVLDKTGSLFEANLLAAAFVGVISEVSAKLFKKPATLFIVSAIIPLVPGALIYKTMASAISGSHSESLTVGMDTLLIAGAIAAGLAFSSSIMKVLFSLRKPRHGLSRR